MAPVYLVTGGGGFIGSNLVRGLLARGDNVRVLDNFSTGFRENLEEVRADVDLVEGDVRNADACLRAARGAEVVFHLAAVPSVPQSMADPQTSFEANLVGMHQMLMAAREAGARRFVFSASSAAYGDSEDLPKRETMPMLPLSPYAAAKAAGELYAATFWRAYGLQTVSLRYFNVFGPRQDPTNQYAGVIAAFASRMLRGRPPVIYGDGTQSRDFIYVENVVHANLLAAGADEVHGEVVNIGSAEATDLNRMVAVFNDILGTDLAPVYDPPRAGDVMHSLADIAAARQLLGYEPRVRFAEGLRQTIEWYRWALETGYGGWARR
ncbi:MAG TPA: SDR family oxidoreductase [Phycisphaerae bacterium]|nr:SDR family oxidoreductase [Phycisphaerae bacterium]